MGCAKCGSKKKKQAVAEEAPLPLYQTESYGGPRVQITANSNLQIRTPKTTGRMVVGNTARLSLYEAQGLIDQGAPIGIIHNYG